MSVDYAVPPDRQALIVVVMIVTCAWAGTLAVARSRQASLRVQRLSLASCVAITAALLASGLVRSQPQPKASDLAPIWASAVARLHDQDPYEAVGPGRAFDTDFPQIYPMTAITAVLPLGLLPLRWADPLFVGLGFGLFTWAVTKNRLRTPALIALVSLGALMTLQTSQWSLLLTGAALVPGFGWLLIAKPTIGLALFATQMLPSGPTDTPQGDLNVVVSPAASVNAVQAPPGLRRWIRLLAVSAMSGPVPTCWPRCCPGTRRRTTPTRERR
jgi:hypothetical protein